jgi:hypothetical protein
MQGADTVIFERLDPGNALNAQLKKVTRAHMEAYGEAGLRTLCLAAVELDAAEYDACALFFSPSPPVYSCLDMYRQLLPRLLHSCLRAACTCTCSSFMHRLDMGLLQHLFAAPRSAYSSLCMS